MNGLGGIANVDGAPVSERSTATFAKRLFANGACAPPTVLRAGSYALIAGVPLGSKAPAPYVACSRGRGRRIVVAALGSASSRDAVPLESDDRSASGNRASLGAEACLSCYRQWGLSAPLHLQGEFLFAIWNEEAQQVVIYRSLYCLQPLYYSRSGRQFQFASEIAPIVLGPNFSRDPNLATVRDHLQRRWTSASATLYKQVYRLPPGHLLCLDARGLRIQRIDSPAGEALIRYNDHRGYADRFLELFEAAVADRLSHSECTGVMVSGGIDSSAIFGVASTVAGKRPESRPVRALSLTFRGRRNDESHYSRLACRHHGTDGIQVAYEDKLQPDYRSECEASGDIPFYPNFYMFTPLIAQAKALGIRIILTGEGGDNWLTGSNYPYASLLSGLYFERAVRELHFRIKSIGLHRELGRILHQVAWLVLPGKLLSWILPLRRRMSVSTAQIPNAFLSEHQHHNLWNADIDRQRLPSLAQWHTVQQSYTGTTLHLLEMLTRHDAQHGIERRHPFFDARMVRFALSVPDYLHHEAGSQKRLLRTLGPSVLPPEIAARRDFVHFTEIYRDFISSSAVAEILLSRRTQERPWTYGLSIKDVYSEAVQPFRYHSVRQANLLQQCWAWFALEMWLRTLIE